MKPNTNLLDNGGSTSLGDKEKTFILLLPGPSFCKIFYNNLQRIKEKMKQLQRQSEGQQNIPPSNSPKHKETRFTHSPVQAASRVQWPSLPDWVGQWDGHAPSRQASYRLVANQPKRRGRRRRIWEKMSEKAEILYTLSWKQVPLNSTGSIPE